MTLHVDSEAGRLRRRHPAPPRPGAEAAHPHQQGRAPLRRRAVGQPRPAGARRLRGRAARPRRRRCTSSATCSPRPWTSPRPGSSSWTGSSTRRSTVRWPPTTCRRPSSELADAELAEALVGGMTKREFLERVAEPASVRFHAMELDDFLLPPAAQPPLHPGHLRLGLRRGVHQRDALAGPAARDGALRGDLPLAPPAVRRRRTSTSGPRGRPTTRPPSRAATSWSSARARC